MSQFSPDTRAVVRAADALTAQVRRIADAMARAADARQDDFALTPDAADDDATTPVDEPTALRDMAATLRHIDSEGFREAAACCEARAFAIEHGLAKTSDDDRPAPAADEDAQRTARRASTHTLLARAAAGLTPDEDALLRQHVEAEQREADTAPQFERAAWDATQHVLELKAELAGSQAAIERVRGAAQWIRSNYPGLAPANNRLRAALDGTEQPTTTKE